MIDYSVVIPVHNGASYLPSLYHRLVPVLEKLTENYEIIMVDDGSADQSWEIMQDLREKNERIKIIQLSKNFGQHNATICGFKYCQGRYVITMDDDLQHPPEEIPKLVQEIEKGYRVVYGKYEKKKHGWIQNFGSRLTNQVLANITENKFDLTSFRMIKKDAVQTISEPGFPNSILDISLLHAVSKNDISYCDVKHDESKTSGYNFWKLFQIASHLMLTYTVFPLRLAIFLGLISSLISFGLGFMYLIQYLLRRIDVSGFTTLVLLITFFSGLLLFVLGVIGEYIGMIYLVASRKPQYIVKEIFL